MNATISWQGDDVDVKVSYQDGYFKQAYASGTPEACYPAEGEMPTVLAVVIDGGAAEGEMPTVLAVVIDGGADILALLDAATVESLEEACWKDQQSREPDDGP